MYSIVQLLFDAQNLIQIIQTPTRFQTNFLENQQGKVYDVILTNRPITDERRCHAFICM